MSRRVLVLHPTDNVAVALAALTPGEAIDLNGSQVAPRIVVQQPVARGHKVALCALAVGQTVIKYGYPVGTVTHSIAAGDHVHTHNLIHARTG